MASFKITIDHTKVEGDLTNFAYLFTEDVPGIPAGFWTVFDQQKIRFWDSTESTELDREIVHFDSVGEEVEAWVNVPSVSSSVDTVIVCNYGDSATPNDDAVWDVRNAQQVLHFQDVTESVVSDSSSNDIDGDPTNMSPSPPVAGRIQEGIAFAGAGYIQYDNNPSGPGKVPYHLDANTGSISMWLKANTVDATRAMWDAGVTGVSNAYMRLYVTSDGDLRFVYRSYSNSFGDDYVRGDVGAGTIQAGTWYHVVWTSDGSNYALYVDGQAVSISYSGNDNGKWFQDFNKSGAADFEEVIGAGTSAVNRFWNGYLDEVRVIDHTMTADEVKAEYNNQNSPATFSSAEEVPNPPTPPTPVTNDIADLSRTQLRWMRKPNWARAPQREFDLNRVIHQDGATTVEITSLNDLLPYTLQYRYTNVNKAEERALLNWFEERKSRTQRFWLPSWKELYTLAEDANVYDDHLLIENAGTFDAFQGIERVFILTHDGYLITRHVTSVAVGPNDTEILYLESVLQREVLMSQVAWFGRFILGRFNDDSLNLQYRTAHVSEVTVEFRELIREYSVGGDLS